MRVADNEFAAFILRTLHSLTDWAVMTIFILEENMGVSV
jgi:hypothetical protein